MRGSERDCEPLSTWAYMCVPVRVNVWSWAYQAGVIVHIWTWQSTRERLDMSVTVYAWTCGVECIRWVWSCIHERDCVHVSDWTWAWLCARERVELSVSGGRDRVYINLTEYTWAIGHGRDFVLREHTLSYLPCRSSGIVSCTDRALTQAPKTVFVYRPTHFAVYHALQWHP